jgi:fibronectin type 3 domain-containing protein
MKSLIFILTFVSITFAQMTDIEKIQEVVQDPKNIQVKKTDTISKDKLELKPQIQIPQSKKSVHDNVFATRDRIFYSLKENVFAYSDKQYVFLSWAAVKEAKNFNVYRKGEGDTKYIKINKKPLIWPKNQGTAVNKYNALMPHAQFSLARAHIKGVIDDIMKEQKSGYVPPEFVPDFVNLPDHAKQAYYDLSKVYHQIALIIGYGYSDSTVVAGKVYSYKIKYLKQDNTEVELGETRIKAGVVKKLTKPTGLKAEAGDTEILLLWDDPPPADTLNGYHVYKATSKSAPFKRCNPIPVLTKRTVNLKGDSLKTPQYAYKDTLVKNYTTYYYKVAPRNPLGQIGPMSDIAAAKPIDLTPPLIPQNVRTDPFHQDSLMISWNLVTKDTLFRADKIKGYHIFKYETYDIATSDSIDHSKYKIGFIPEPGKKAGSSGIERDTCIYDGNVIPEKVYWYCVSCEDKAGNIGRKTAAVYAILPDFTPPDPPLKNTVFSEGYNDYIKISWQPPDTTKKKNKDLAGYKIYRGICGDVKETIRGITEYYPLHILADVNNKTQTTYSDYSVPKGSPICYRYALKAYDKAQNLSVMSDSTCARLEDKTPPDPPVITALQARDRAIKIECAAAPIQDMKGFKVERSENRNGPYKEVYSDPAPQSVTCKDIPVSVNTVMAKKAHLLSFTDKTVDPEKIYWYRVIAFDYNKNPSKPSPPVSTYTFEIKKLAKPVQLKANLNKVRHGCSVSLTWNQGSTRSPDNFLGYVVFRSFKKDKGYRQLTSPVKETKFEDTAVAPGMTCWYKVQAFDSNGDRSPVSDAVSISIIK